MLEVDVNGFMNELNSMIQNKNNNKPIRITLKRYYPDIKGCKKKRKIQEENIKSEEKNYHNLVRIADGKRRKSKVLLKNNKDSTTLINELSEYLSKIDNSKKISKIN